MGGQRVVLRREIFDLGPKKKVGVGSKKVCLWRRQGGEEGRGEQRLSRLETAIAAVQVQRNLIH